MRFHSRWIYYLTQFHLGKVINQVTKFVQERVPFPLGEQIHEFVPRDQVRSKTANTTPWPHIRRVHILLL